MTSPATRDRRASAIPLVVCAGSVSRLFRVVGLRADRALELPDSLARRATELRQALRSEDDERDQHHDRDLHRAYVGHRSALLVALEAREVLYRTVPLVDGAVRV